MYQTPQTTVHCKTTAVLYGVQCKLLPMVNTFTNVIVKFVYTPFTKSMVVLCVGMVLGDLYHNIYNGEVALALYRAKRQSFQKYRLHQWSFLVHQIVSLLIT